MEIISLRLKMANIFGVEFKSNSECRLFFFFFVECNWTVLRWWAHHSSSRKTKDGIEIESVLFILRIPPKEKSTNTSPDESYSGQWNGCSDVETRWSSLARKLKTALNPQTQPSYGSGPCLAKLDVLARETEGSLFQPLLAGTLVKNAARPAL